MSDMQDTTPERKLLDAEERIATLQATVERQAAEIARYRGAIEMLELEAHLLHFAIQEGDPKDELLIRASDAEKLAQGTLAMEDTNG